ncbi:MAG: SelB C-terminal domain-containing protein [Nannocystaceae bacterium]|nr:SelB C-terminal domain-containing protein [Nannocystaceae bacterium]
MFETSPIVPISALTGEGIEDLTRAIKKLVAVLPRRDAKGDPLIPLDRAFSIKGHGTVVTGTQLQGSLDVSKDSSLILVPAGVGRETRAVRARQAQVRGSDESRIGPSSRVAVNLAGVELSDISRGDVLCRGPLVQRGLVFHAAMQHLPGRTQPWARGTVVQVCAGTAFSVGRLDPLWLAPSPDHQDPDPGAEVTIPPGREGLVRVRLETPVPVWRDMRVVLRDFSGPPPATASEDQGRTIGGGVVIDPNPSAGRGQRGRWVTVGRALTETDLDQRLMALVHDAHTTGVSTAELHRRAGLADAGTRLTALADGRKPQVVALGGQRWGHIEHLRPLVQAVVAGVDRYHVDNPMQPGASRATVEAMLGSRVAADIAAWAVDQAQARGTLQTIDDAGTLARPGKGVQVSGELPEHMQRVLDVYTRLGMTAPTVKEVTAQCGLDPRKTLEILGVLQRTGRLVKVTPDISMAVDAHDKLVEDVKRHLAEHSTIDVQALKALSGWSRKYAVPFLEHLDQLQVTRRDGDTRHPGPKA